MIDDLRHYRAADLGAFQIVEQSLAYDAFWLTLIVAAIVL